MLVKVKVDAQRWIDDGAWAILLHPLAARKDSNRMGFYAPWTSPGGSVSPPENRQNSDARQKASAKSVEEGYAETYVRLAFQRRYQRLVDSQSV